MSIYRTLSIQFQLVLMLIIEKPRNTVAKTK